MINLYDILPQFSTDPKLPDNINNAIKPLIDERKEIYDKKNHYKKKFSLLNKQLKELKLENEKLKASKNLE